MPPGRKRRAEVEPDSGSDAPSHDEGPSNTQRRRRNAPAESEDEGNGADESTLLDAETAGDVDGSREQLVKKLVRYALACEFGRVPIRREGIREKVFGKHSGRRFQQIFDGAQFELQMKFGMEMTELPLKEKVTLRDRRAAAQKQAAAPATRAYILTTTIPQQYQTPAILPPSRIPSAAAESAYVGLYTLIVSLILLVGGTVSDEKLMRYLQRLNANVNTPVDKTEAVLARMLKQGYVVKIRDNSGGDDTTEWMVGPRGKVEIGAGGVKGLVEAVYGDAPPEDLEARLRVSLGIKGGAGEVEGDDGEGEERAPARRGRGRPRREEVEE